MEKITGYIIAWLLGFPVSLLVLIWLISHLYLNEAGIKFTPASFNKITLVLHK
ncbi:hypothetical protein LLB_3351 [Legionella longbeachae D-4968]|nr:hypothetical protein LLB_3351 [Legionella longbeachae D-4968]